MLLTAAWAGSLAIGKCDLNAYDEAIEGSGYGKISCNRQVIYFSSHYNACDSFSLEHQNVQLNSGSEFYLPSSPYHDG